jgi:iron complex outermembrane recepter protein
MNRYRLSHAFRHGAAFAALATTGAVFAQDAAPADASAESLDEIVVTGTRIRTPNLESPSPIASLDAAALAYTGKTSLQEIVSEIGALAGSEGNSEVSNGENVLVLRNLGAGRTLVLVDGLRMVGGVSGSGDLAGLGGSSAVDTNVIPSAMVERVDVLTGGASAIYGADAVTGVVNFILKKDFEGIAFSSQYGDAEDGDFRDQVHSATFGRNFGEGRGNITVNYTYGDRPLTLATARAQSSTDVHEQINNLNGTNPRYVLAPGTNDAFFTDGGASIDAFRVFSSGFNGDGTPFRHGVNVGSFAGTGEIGGDGLPNWKMFAQGIRPSNRRHLLALNMTYEVADALKPFLSINYADIQSRSVDQGTLTVGMPTARDNAFLPASVLAAAPAGAPIMFNRWDLDSGFRNTEIEKELSRIVAGARGDLGDHLAYEVSANFGKLERLERTANNRMFDRYIAAIDSVVDPVSGRIVCRSTLDPSSFNRLRSDALATSFNPALGAVTFTPGANSGCVPFNPFTRDNSVNDAARDWIWIPTEYNIENKQTVFQGFLTYDTGAFFELPGGAVSVVTGAEYRKEESNANYDELSGSPRTVASTPGLDLAGEFSVKEAFGEISLPLVGDVHPALRGVTVDAAYRYSDYTTIGSTGTWKTGLIVETIGGLTLRGTFSSAVRAPNIVELFEPRTNISVSMGQFDPCSTTNVSLGSGARRANCETALRALGVNPATFNPLLGTYFPATQGGNVDLQEETAKTRTLGFIWQPTFVAGVIATVDYFDVRIEDAVLRPNHRSIFNACYDAPTLDNVFCSLLSRETGTGFANFVEIQSVNVAEMRTSGVELTTRYSLPAAAIGRFLVSVSGTWLERLDIQKTPLPVLTDDKGLFNTDTGGSSPEWVANFDLTWMFGDWDVNYGVGYSSKTLRPPLINAQRATADSFIDDPYVKAYINHDIQVGYQIMDSARAYAGVRNIADEYPDNVRGSSNGPSGRQGFAGRSFYVGVDVKFDGFWE